MFTCTTQESCKVHITAEPAAGTAGAGEGQVVAYDEAESQKAIQDLLKSRPDVITLDHDFAISPKGVRLIERIMSDPMMAGANVVVELSDGKLYRYAPGQAGPSIPEAPTRIAKAGKTRRAPRVPTREGVEIIVDGKPATLLDLSIIGAQVVSVSPIRPGKRVRVVLPNDDATLQVAGVAVWSRLEMLPGGKGSRYRAGLFFPEPDPVALLSFCGRCKA